MYSRNYQTSSAFAIILILHYLICSFSALTIRSFLKIPYSFSLFFYFSKIILFDFSLFFYFLSFFLLVFSIHKLIYAFYPVTL